MGSFRGPAARYSQRRYAFLGYVIICNLDVSETVYKAHENGALPRDVIKISALAGGAGKKERVNHPTQKPLELCEKLIKAAKNEKDTIVVVPFAGSGSECVAAKRQGVDFIAFEINNDYIELCNKRLLDDDCCY